MKKWERLGALALLGTGAGAAIEAVRLGFGTMNVPGPGFLPFWLALLLAVTAGIYLVSLFGEDPAPVAFWPDRTWLRPVLSVAIMLLYATLLDRLGFALATLLLFVLWLLVIERERPLLIGLVSVAGTLAAYTIFTVLLKVPLPTGTLFR